MSARPDCPGTRYGRELSRFHSFATANEELIPIFEGTVDPDLVEEGRRNLIDFFQQGLLRRESDANLQNQVSLLSCLQRDRGSRHR